MGPEGCGASQLNLRRPHGAGAARQPWRTAPGRWWRM